MRSARPARVREHLAARVDRLRSIDPSTAAAKAARNVRPPMDPPPQSADGVASRQAGQPTEQTSGAGGYFFAGAPAVSILQVPSKKTPRSMTMAAVVRLPRTLAGAFSSMPFDAVASPW